MVYRFVTFRSDTRIIVLQLLQVLHLYITATKFYELPKLKFCSVKYACFRKLGCVWNKSAHESCMLMETETIVMHGLTSLLNHS